MVVAIVFDTEMGETIGLKMREGGGGIVKVAQIVWRCFSCERC